MITSRTNPAVKSVRALRQRRERERTGSYFVEGIRLVAEAVDLRAPIETLVVAPHLLQSRFASDVLTEAERRSLPRLEVSAEVFSGISGKDGPQGMGAVVRQSWETLDSIDPRAGLCWVGLDRVADPGNLGSIVRTCEAVGGSGILLVDHTTDPHDPAALRASMGAIFSQRLVRTTVAQLVAWKETHSVTLVGTSDGASLDYRRPAYRFPLVLLMGSEREGLDPELQRCCDELVRIPMVGRSDSLNLAVATGVMLYEIYNQHSQRR